MKSYKILGLLFLASTQFFAQKKDENIGVEIVNIVKPYSPTISDAFKAKEVPVIEDNVNTQKQEIEYNIFSFPVASTFTPSKGLAKAIDPPKKETYFQNYVRLAGGNYGTIDGEAALSYAVNRTDYLALFANHRSSTGGIKDLYLDDKYSLSNAKLYYGSKSRYMDWKVGLGYKRNMFNWYGLPSQIETWVDPTVFDNLNVKNVYSTFGVDGQFTADNSILEKGEFFFKHFRDKKDSQENHFFIKPTASFEAGGFDIEADFIVDYLNGSFARGYQNFLNPMKQDYTLMNFGVQPRVSYVFNDDIHVKAGVGVFYSNTKHNGDSDNKLYIYPQVTASYAIVDGILVAFAGLEGGLQQNSFASLVDRNPFVSPTQYLQPTSNTYDLYAGLNGKIASNVSFNVKGGYKRQSNYAFFVNNLVLSPSLATNDFQPYEYGNSFKALYSDLKTLQVSGNIQYDITKESHVGVFGEVNSYTTSQAEAWNLPTVKIGAETNVKVTDKWFAGAKLFYVGERYGNENVAITDPAMNTVIESNTITLKSYFDLNFNLLYKHNDQLSGFVKLNNVTGQDYMRYNNYPVQGFQFLLGASYNFDF
ncbi:TonB-dependent receptor [Flavobacterium agricola]|uniref:TonB-dependent receptor n=1 Tax=Flavobacterium agricola TaxID=2870839 RepID=A0ABY6LVX5_9FLAO|nr:TonB-dependent receptor [Flavobacterium agricola]UYW00386.1 TonB-dependent receptor [Flavobacterium agricola]